MNVADALTDLPWIGDAAQVLALAAAICLAWWLRAPAAVFVLWVTGRTRRDAAAWWSNRQLTTALVHAGILRPHDGERLNLSYRGAPRTNDAGTTVTVALPQARTLTDVLARREYLAAALRVPLARLEVTQADDDPGNVVRIHVANPPTRDVPAQVTTQARTSWVDPVRIGRDSRGEPVHLHLPEQNSLISGRPGSGKTSVAKLLMGHVLLDPTAHVYAVDGKGSTADYGHARPLCAGFVSGVDEDAVPDTITMLGTVLELVRTRNASGDGDHPGVLLLLEEYQDIRAAADRAEGERLDNCLGRIVRMGRAVGVHVVISTQRPSVDDVPSGVRNLVSQRLALMLRNGADAALVLGHTPSLPLPRRRGQALLATAAGTRAVTLDRLTEDAWRALCARATALRATHTPTPPLDMAKPSQARTEAPTALPDPLLEAVLDVLADADPAGMTATELHAALPDWHEFVPTPRALGLELRRHPEVERVNRRSPAGASIRVWRSVNGQCQRTVNAVSSLTLVDTRIGVSRAQVAASDSAGPKAARAGVDR